MGGSDRPDDDKTAQHVLFVTGGQILYPIRVRIIILALVDMPVYRPALTGLCT